MCFDRLVTGCDQVLSKKQDLLYRIVEQELQFFLLHIVLIFIRSSYRYFRYYRYYRYFFDTYIYIFNIYNIYLIYIYTYIYIIYIT